jgi:hypothetical protein
MTGAADAANRSKTEAAQINELLCRVLCHYLDRYNDLGVLVQVFTPF